MQHTFFPSPFFHLRGLHLYAMALARPISGMAVAVRNALSMAA